jgi:hypothetical protein
VFALFSVLYLGLMIVMALHIYYYGAIKADPRKMIPIICAHSCTYWNVVLYKKKFVLSFFFFLLLMSLPLLPSSFSP